MATWLRHCLVAVTILFGVCPVDPARILGVFPFENWSHTQFFLPLMRELASRGHQVTVISHMKDQQPMANYTAISLHGLVPLCSNLTINRVTDMALLEAIMWDIMDPGITSSRTIYESDVIRRFNQSDAEFDVVIVEIFNTDSFVPFAHRFKAPLIAASSSAPYPWYSERLGMSNNPSYISTLVISSGTKMSFWGRLFNTAMLLFAQIAYRVHYRPGAEQVAREFFGPQMPPLADLVANTSLLLLNTHPSFTVPRTVPPGVVEVAGISLKAPKKLPKDLEEFISGAKHGVVYFSLGSILDGASFQPEKKRALVEAFAALPQRVLWRGEQDPETGTLPPNIRMVRWVPQTDVLRHKNTKLFITHGGLFSLIESISTATPILGMPFFADQFENVKTAEEAGFGLMLRYQDLTKENLHRLIKTLLTDSRYATTAKTISERFNDRPMSPMDTAIYWIEYVIRHKGAYHLQSPSVTLPWYQVYLLDVISFVLCAGVTIVALLKLAIRIFVSSLLKSAVPNKEKLS